MVYTRVQRENMSSERALLESMSSLRIAVLIPCLNEEAAVGKVVAQFSEVLPHATIYVFDNNSTDETAKCAIAAGAIVRNEPRQGKGFVVCRMFAEIDADIYILVDGDGTYDASSAPSMIGELIENHLDMVCAKRKSVTSKAYRFGHEFGNRFLSNSVTFTFGSSVEDMLTGYRVLSRRYVKSFPALSEGFEIETQMTVHALEMRMRFTEIETPYYDREEGTVSKLNTISDGMRISRTILFLLKEERPLAFFGFMGAILATVSILLVLPIFIEYVNTGLVPRFPTAILSTGIMLLAFLSLSSGLILDSVSHGRRELKRLYYLSISPTSELIDKKKTES